KERFKIPWLPHELQVLCSFAAIGLVLFFALDTARKYIPDDKQQLEYRVRLKYKLNEKYQQLVTKSPEGKPSMLVSFIQKQPTHSWIKSISYWKWIRRKNSSFCTTAVVTSEKTIKSSGILRRIKTPVTMQRPNRLLPLRRPRPRRLLPRSSPLLPARAQAGSRGF